MPHFQQKKSPRLLVLYFISFYIGLSGQKDGSSEKQSITNFFPMDFHNNRGINVESDMREDSVMITNNIIKKKKKGKKSQH